MLLSYQSWAANTVCLLGLLNCPVRWSAECGCIIHWSAKNSTENVGPTTQLQVLLGHRHISNKPIKSLVWIQSLVSWAPAHLHGSDVRFKNYFCVAHPWTPIWRLTKQASETILLKMPTERLPVQRPMGGGGRRPRESPPSIAPPFPVAVSRLPKAILGSLSDVYYTSIHASVAPWEICTTQCDMSFRAI